MDSQNAPPPPAPPPGPRPAADGRHNRLAREKSPYLLQHAANPIDWYPWGSEAFGVARREGKPIFLSIGYSTCHWCHVMAHESFEDPEVARLLTEAFVAIKVDREERPDIDAVFMEVCQRLTGSGGWPLTILLTPDGKPFFAATYVPRTTRFGRTGLLELIPRIKDVWDSRRDDVLRSADSIAAALQQPTRAEAGGDLGADTLAAAAAQLAMSFDQQHGGFGSAPKFPTPHNLLFLLRHWRRTGDAHALEMVEATLQAMRRGGIFDHVGFGFHRYATDRAWLVPHFEKMLYDQALLVIAYAEACQATGKQAYAEAARETLAYVLRDLASPQGAFYSAEDADSEGVEGKFYLWTVPEIRRLLGPVDADLAIRAFGLQDGGNFAAEDAQAPEGASILHLPKPLDRLAIDLRLPEAALHERLEAIRQKLFDTRSRRVRPHRDDKILTDWNGLMIAALAKAAQALDEPRYAQAARGAADFILRELRRPDGRLLHAWRDGSPSAAPAHVDDYAFLTWGLLELYEATFDAALLDAALNLNRLLLAHYWDADAGGLFFTPDDGETLLLRQKVIVDGAVPSGNSVAMLNLLRLALITGDSAHEERAASLARAFSAEVAPTPIAFTHLMLAVDFALGPSHEVVIAGGPGSRDTEAMLRALRTPFLPNKIVLFRPSDREPPGIARIAPFTRGQRPVDGRATAYVCLHGACRTPTTDIPEMLAELRLSSPSQ